MIYDERDKKHRLWIRRMRVGPELSWRTLSYRDKDVLLHKVAPSVQKQFLYRPEFSLGATFEEARRHLKSFVARQTHYLRTTDYVQLRAWVGWTVHEGPAWMYWLRKKLRR